MVIWGDTRGPIRIAEGSLDVAAVERMLAERDQSAEMTIRGGQVG